MEQKFFCYKIINLINGKIYIGKATDIEVRFSKHKMAAKLKNPNDFSVIHRAINKYGADNFIIEKLSEHLSEAEALEQEIIYIKQFNSKNKNIGYNLTDGGEGSSGYKHTQESILKMKNNKRNNFGDKNSFYGKHHTEESIKKMSESHIKFFEENGHPWTGKTHSVESKKKMSLSAIGRKISLETRDKISISLKGNLNCITSAKLLEKDVIKIKIMLINSDLTHDEIAKKFGVSRTAITLINCGKTWNHIKI